MLPLLKALRELLYILQPLLKALRELLNILQPLLIALQELLNVLQGVFFLFVPGAYKTPSLKQTGNYELCPACPLFGLDGWAGNEYEIQELESGLNKDFQECFYIGWCNFIFWF